MPNPNILAWARGKIRSYLINRIKSGDRVLISDTTLRDGEQAPGAAIGIGQKLLIARKLDELGVDAIEAGFPVSSNDDFEAVRVISKKVRRPVISVLSRCLKSDIDAAVQSLKGARRWGITLFIGTSPLLRQHSINKSQDEIIEIIRDSIKYAGRFTDVVSFGPEDATRTELPYLYKVYEEAIEAGALTVGYTDTVGWLIPEQVKDTINGIMKNVRNINKALFGIHFHNDLGLALANSLAAVECGANIIQCTVNGLGERAGNTSLEELVMALRTKRDFYKKRTNIHAKKLYETSRLVSRLTGVMVSPNKPIVGDNAFASEAGIHQAALLKERFTYEIMNPKEVGQSGTKLVLGRHSGKHALLHKLDELGYKIAGHRHVADFDAVYTRFKELASSKKEITDEDLILIAKEFLGGK